MIVLGVFLAALTIIVGLFALYVWIAANQGPIVAFGVVGGTTAGLSILIFVVAALRARRPAPDSDEPRAQTRLHGVVSPSLAEAIRYDAGRAVKAASDAIQAAGKSFGASSREALFSVLGVAVIAGFLTGRRFRRPEA
jgi:hypothetical protein